MKASLNVANGQEPPAEFSVGYGCLAEGFSMAVVEPFPNLLFRNGQSIDRKITGNFSNDVVVTVRLEIGQMDVGGI
jgi:hypothetical protein